MTFQPQIGHVLTIRGVDYKVAEHPSAPGIPYGQEGRQGIVYQLAPLNQSNHSLAIKVFRPKYRMPSLVKQAKGLIQFNRIQGLTVTDRFVLNTEDDSELLNKEEDLLYSAVMPWIEGPTWSDIIYEKKKLTQKESLETAKSLAKVLSQMEQEELAHCDLSAPNVLLPGLVKNHRNSYVELVDLEQMYSKKMDKPDVLPIGSPGYAAHKSIKNGLWGPEADRFSGAILLIEMLSWSDADIVEHAWGDSYFEPNELQQDTERYERMLGSLRTNWGEEIAQLFMQAWKSEELDQCPTFGEWALKLNKVTLETSSDSSLGWDFKQAKEQAQLEDAFKENPQVTIQELLVKATKLEREAQLAKALDIYRTILQRVDPSDAMAEEIRIIISDLEEKLQDQQREKTAAPINEAKNNAPREMPNQPQETKQKPKKKKKKVPIFIMTVIILLAAIGGTGYAFHEKIPFLNKLIGDETPVVASKESKETTETKDEAAETETTKTPTKEEVEIETVSLWDIASIGYSGDWQTDNHAKTITLRKGEKNNYISHDLTKLKVGKAKVEGTITAEEGIPFEVAFYIDSEEVYKTDSLTAGQTVPFEFPINKGNVLTIKVLNNSIEGDDNNKSTFTINEMVMEIHSKDKGPEPINIVSLWSSDLYLSRGDWKSDTHDHSVYVDNGEKNNFVSFDISTLNISKAMLTGVVVPSGGIPFSLEFYVDNEPVFKTEEIDPSKSGPVPLNILVKGKTISVKVINNSVYGDNSKNSEFELKELLVNVYEENADVEEPTKESLWTKGSTAFKGDWRTDPYAHTVYLKSGNNGDSLTLDLSGMTLNNAKLAGALLGSGIPYQLEFKVDDQVVHLTEEINPNTEVPIMLDIPVNGKVLSVTLINKSVDGDDSKKTYITFKDLLLETY